MRIARTTQAVAIVVTTTGRVDLAGQTDATASGAVAVATPQIPMGEARPLGEPAVLRGHRHRPRHQQ